MAATKEQIFYVYSLRVEDQQEPFYIGKGKDYRAYSHLRESNLNEDGNRHKANTIIKAQSLGKKIVVDFIVTDISEEDALKIEVWCIHLYGRRDMGTGCLTNLSDGGENSTLSEEQREHLSQKMKGVRLRLGHKSSPEHVARIAAANTGRKRTVEQRAVLSQIHTGKKASAETKEKMSKSASRKKTPEEIEKIRQAHIGRTQEKVTCPHCNLTGSISNMKRYHFDKCKQMVNTNG